MSKNGKRKITINKGIYNERSNKGTQVGGNIVLKNDTSHKDVQTIITLIQDLKAYLLKSEDINSSDMDKIRKYLESVEDDLKKSKFDRNKSLKKMKNAAQFVKSISIAATSTENIILMFEKIINWFNRA